jgi:hypothetical protein
MNYYEAFRQEVRIKLSEHIELILGSRRRGEREQRLEGAMIDLERIFRDYGVDWKLAESSLGIVRVKRR